MPVGRQKTPQEIAQELNKKFREAIGLYSSGKITLDQVTQRFYDAQKSIHPSYWLDPEFQMIALDKSGMSMNEVGAFSIANLQSTQRRAKEQGLYDR